MRRYKILNIIRTIGNTNHVYTAQRNGEAFTDRFVNTTMPDTKLESDFICLPNCTITAAQILPNGERFVLDERTTQGRITGFRTNNNNIEVYLNNARITSVPLANITKLVVRPAAPPQAVTTAATTAAAPSRSTQNRNPFSQIETTILASERGRQLRLEKFLKKNLPPTLREFLVKFFKEYNGERCTIYVDDKTVQTTEDRRRSLGDVFKICKYYYPECTLSDIIRELYVGLPQVIRDGFRTSICSTIHKRVWYYASGDDNGVFDKSSNDEYGNNVTFYTSKL